MRLGETIYRLRTAAHLSQGDLADALNVSRQSVSKWENDTAVPELDKLIKISQLFGITLDELVGIENKEADSPPDTEATQTPVPETETKQGLSPLRISGIILLAFGGLCFVVFTVVGLFTNLILLGLLIALPFVLCGTICMVCQHNIGLLCGWSLYLPLWLVCTVLTVRTYGTMHYLVGIILLLWGLILTVITIRRMRQGKLGFSKWGNILLSVLMITLTSINIWGILPPMDMDTDNPFINESTVIVTPIEPDSSKTPTD